jgi:putative transposase
LTNEEKTSKNKRISETKRATVSRHLEMDCKTFDVKIQENSLSKQQKEALERIFLEQKWYKNFIINWSNKSDDNKLSKFDTRQTSITKKDKDMNDVEVQIQYLSAQSRQCLLSRMLSNAKAIKTLSTKGFQKGGHLKFSKEETIIDLKQYGVSHKIVSDKRVRIAGIKKTLVVNGLKQFMDIEGIEYANARLLKRPSGYYIQFVCYVPKESKQYRQETIGVDFGCETSFTLSNGEKIQALVQESDRLKRLQRKLNKKTKQSKNWHKCKSQLNKEHERLTNKKNDLANKIVHKLCGYETVVIQDEQIAKWHKNGHGKKVQHSVLGRVKAKLKTKSNVVVLDKYVPTTKVCIECGCYHDELKVSDRTFRCDCGVEMDRDIHAAQNMVWFYENNVGVGRTELKRVEMQEKILDAIEHSKQSALLNHEDSTL